MANLIRQSNFARQLLSLEVAPTDTRLRQLAFDYCRRYQDDYWFHQLENAFAYLEIVLEEKDFDPADWISEYESAKNEVECAIGEYFISLNEVARAIHRLLDQREMTIHDTLDALDHVWSAHACNESPEEFTAREDNVLCELLTSI